MGKKGRQSTRKEPTKEDDSFDRMPEPDKETEEYFNDDIEQFALKKEKILLNANDDDSNDESDYLDEDGDDEIMKLDSDMDEDEDEDDVEFEEEGDNEDDEDFLAEENENADLPTGKAWGKRKKEFYDSNLKDADHFENEEEEEFAAVEEEKEAMELQQRMLSHLGQEDFDFFEEEPSNEESNLADMEEETHVFKDLQKLSKEEKIQILLKDSPELFVLLDDYQSKLREVVERYHPLLLVARKGGRISKEGQEFIEVMHQLLLNYSLNISFYLSLVAKRENVKDHPVIEKILEYRNLLSKVEPLVKRFENEMKTVLMPRALAKDTSREEEDADIKTDLQALIKEARSKKSIVSTSESENRKPAKKGKAQKASKDSSIEDPWEYYNSVANKAKEKKIRNAESHERSREVEDGENEDEDMDGKRAITYEMEKNKGLMRKRKKENRNPRVKHKMKFKKAIVKRKSQVQAIRNEAVNYGGERTGIRSRLTKSVKIK